MKCLICDQKLATIPAQGVGENDGFLLDIHVDGKNKIFLLHHECHKKLVLALAGFSTREEDK